MHRREKRIMNNEMLYYKLMFVTKILNKRNSSDKNISMGQGRILAILNMHEGISTKELSEILNIKVTSLNETLNKLLNKGYIKKEVSKEDKRVLLIYLTDKGREFKFEKPKDMDVFDCLSSEEKEDFDRFLTLISEEIRKKFMSEDPEKYEEIQKHREKIFKKYFNCEKGEWFKLVEKH